ncbi:hypothetical protein HPB47_027405 [Ixodes persulcatus]|uniref:Uncharacterized protein n=1 Tax=Ixodes persulcatus TaxID=34615 RepID=A0AC60PVX6_IXOPE|nr:hypothetical protein HPB47_027405 [Ixodes persulcatus]
MMAGRSSRTRRGVAWLGEASLTQGGCDGSSARYTTAKLSEEGPPTQATTGPSTARRGTSSGRSNSELACGGCRRCVRLRRWDQRTGVGCAERGLWRLWRGGDCPGRVGGWPAAQRARGDDGALSAERAPLRLVSGFAAAIRSLRETRASAASRRLPARLLLPPGGPTPFLSFAPLPVDRCYGQRWLLRPTARMSGLSNTSILKVVF